MEFKKKICLIGHESGYYKGQGGIATYIELTAKGFIKLGLDVHVIYIHGSGVDSPLVTSWKLKEQHDNFEISKEVDSILEKIKPDYVECTDFLGMVSYTLSKRALKCLDYDCVFISNHHTGIKEVWEWGTNLDFIECAPPWMRVLYIAERTQSLLSDANFSTSKFLANYLDNIHCEDYQVCPSYYEMSHDIQLSKPNHYDRKCIKILSLGRFELRKKQELLIRAVCELLNEGFDIETTLIGNSDRDFYSQQNYMEYCYSFIPPELKIKFHFYDFLPYKELQKKYVDYDLFIISSPYENFPNTALEAINYGIAVLGSKSSGIADIMGDELQNFCFEKNSVADIKRVIVDYNDLDAEQRQVFRLKQRSSLQQLTSFETTIKRRFESYEKINRRTFNKEISEKDYLLVYQDRDMSPSRIHYCDKVFYVGNFEWKKIINNIKYIILLADGNSFCEESNFYPQNGVISCFSYMPPYGTPKEILNGEKAFSKMTLRVENVTFRTEWNIIDYISHVLLGSKELIFFKDDVKQQEYNIGTAIKYKIDLYKYNCGGDICL